MSGDAAIPGVDLEAVTRAYLEAFTARDVGRCLEFYAEDAHIDFQMGVFRGRTGIEAWHKERFAANLSLVRLESVVVRGDTVVIDAVAASNRLAAWKIKELAGRITLTFDQARITRAQLAPRMMSPIDMIRSE